MRLIATTLAAIFMALSSAQARDYFNRKLFDYPDPLTSPRFANGCAKYLVTKSFKCRGLKCSHSEARVCVNPTHVKVALLRKDVRLVVSGPNSVDQAVINAVEGVAAGCAAAAIAAGGTPTPASVAAPAVFYAAFQACILGTSAAGVAGGIIRELNIRIDSSGSHWSPV